MNGLEADKRCQKRDATQQRKHFPILSPQNRIAKISSFEKRYHRLKMEAWGEAKSIFIDKIMPPRLEDAGLEDCALPLESIREAFLKAAASIKSFVSDSGDEGGCVEAPWEESSDALVGITDGFGAPSEGCSVEKGRGSTEAEEDLVVAGGGDEAKAKSKSDALVGIGLPEVGEKACVDGLRGLEIGGKGRGTLGKKDDVANGEEKGDDDDDDDDKPILVEGCA